MQFISKRPQAGLFFTIRLLFMSVVSSRSDVGGVYIYIYSGIDVLLLF